VARRLAPYLNWLAPSLGQISDDADSFVNGLSNSFIENEVEFGIIEARRDRVIQSGHTYLSGARDLASVDGHHGILTWYPRTIALVETFLRQGNFAQFECDKVGKAVRPGVDRQLEWEGGR
jgi:hypothetical protein